VSPGILPRVHGLARDPSLPCSAWSSSAWIRGQLLARDAIGRYVPVLERHHAACPKTAAGFAGRYLLSRDLWIRPWAWTAGVGDSHSTACSHCGEGSLALTIAIADC
jgi:hypothetical protein